MTTRNGIFVRADLPDQRLAVGRKSVEIDQRQRRAVQVLERFCGQLSDVRDVAARVISGARRSPWPEKAEGGETNKTCMADPSCPRDVP